MFLAWQNKKSVDRAWGSASQMLDVRYKPGSFFGQPRLTGEVAGMQVEVDVYSSGSGDSRTNYTRYDVRHFPVGPPLKITKQGTFSIFGRIVGRKDVQIGDPFFDDRVVIDTEATDAIQAFLTPTRQAAVLDLFATWQRGHFTQSSVTVETRGVEKNGNRIHSTVMRLVETAEVMGAARVDAILEHQRQGSLGQAAEELHELNAEKPNAFTEILEAEALVEMGRHEEAAEIFDRVGQRLPDDPSIDRWRDLSHLPPPPPPLPPRPPTAEELAMMPAPPPPPVSSGSELPSPPPTAPPATEFASASASTDPASTDPAPAEAAPVANAAPAVALDQQSVIDDLFAADRMSWEIVEYFEGTYQNATVTWKGEVTSFNTYLHDSDFGEGPGGKAAVLLGRSGNSEFISSEVHAMVQLADGVEVERGGQIVFRGVLAHVDRFSRKVYVQHASIMG